MSAYSLVSCKVKSSLVMNQSSWPSKSILLSFSSLHGTSSKYECDIIPLYHKEIYIVSPSFPDYLGPLPSLNMSQMASIWSHSQTAHGLKIDDLPWKKIAYHSGLNQCVWLPLHWHLERLISSERSLTDWPPLASGILLSIGIRNWIVHGISSTPWTFNVLIMQWFSNPYYT